MEAYFASRRLSSHPGCSQIETEWKATVITPNNAVILNPVHHWSTLTLHGKINLPCLMPYSA